MDSSIIVPKELLNEIKKSEKVCELDNSTISLSKDLFERTVEHNKQYQIYCTQIDSMIKEIESMIKEVNSKFQEIEALNYPGKNL